MNRIYEVMKSPGFNNDRDLQRQLRRASTSIMSNMAEGFEGGEDQGEPRLGTRDYFKAVTAPTLERRTLPSPMPTAMILPSGENATE